MGFPIRFFGANSILTESSTSAITPCAGFGTITQYKITQRRVINRLYVEGTFKSGSQSAVTLSFTLPGGLTIDYKQQSTATQGQLVGLLAAPETSAALNLFGIGYAFCLFTDGVSTTEVFGAYRSETTGFKKETVNNIIPAAANGTVTIKFDIPILEWSSE